MSFQQQYLQKSNFPGQSQGCYPDGVGQSGISISQYFLPNSQKYQQFPSLQQQSQYSSQGEVFQPQPFKQLEQHSEYQEKYQHIYGIHIEFLKLNNKQIQREILTIKELKTQVIRFKNKMDFFQAILGSVYKNDLVAILLNIANCLKDDKRLKEAAASLKEYINQNKKQKYKRKQKQETDLLGKKRKRIDISPSEADIPSCEQIIQLIGQIFND